MNAAQKDDDVSRFLTRVMEIEEKYAFAKKGQDSARKDELRALLEDFCK